MKDLGVIDGFMDTFGRYIDGGFGLLSGDVAFLSSTLIGIDVTLAALFWTLGGEDNVLGRLIKKILYVGAFAFILNDFKNLADVVYRSFSGLGLKASASGMSAADLLKPGKIAATGYEAAHPLLQQASNLVGFPEIFGNALTIVVLLVAWFLVVLAFFILSIQLFITVLEFKLTTLAGFVLVPFALWGKTAFLAERVLGNVISSGVKVMALAVIVGVGSTLFSTFTGDLQGQDPDLAAAMSQVLGALALLGLAIFAPAIAAGLVSGAPQLGAGAALGTAGAAVGAVALTGGAALAGARMTGQGGLAAIRAGASMGSFATTAYELGQAAAGETGAAGVAAGMGGIARATGGAALAGARNVARRAAASLTESVGAGRSAAWTATGGESTTRGNAPPSIAASADRAPSWGKRLHAEQFAHAHAHAARQAIHEGDRPGHGANPSLHDKDD
ncbi:P-type conjugative transfer protein TrbL [Methylocystis sp. JAN1]|uniref:P-type conjugative transfer protein TrbL n=1 Tax=Methylocystis sp. JAN1 TaxID=3397211 RepID=UPI003FA21977